MLLLVRNTTFYFVLCSLPAVALFSAQISVRWKPRSARSSRWQNFAVSWTTAVIKEQPLVLNKWLILLPFCTVSPNRWASGSGRFIRPRRLVISPDSCTTMCIVFVCHRLNGKTSYEIYSFWSVRTTHWTYLILPTLLHWNRFITGTFFLLS